MTKQNLCILCGKQRVTVSTHKETVNNSVVITKNTVCPDPECQKKVDKMLRAEKQKRLKRLSRTTSQKKIPKKRKDISLKSKKTKS